MNYYRKSKVRLREIRYLSQIATANMNCEINVHVIYDCPVKNTHAADIAIVTNKTIRGDKYQIYRQCSNTHKENLLIPL